jgi:hypothetical protein
MASDPASGKKAPELDFNALVLSLGSSAIVHLGEAPDPTNGEKTAPDFAMAQQSIDLLAMLEEKTRGNLTDDERKFLDGMLFDLRMLFVQISQRTSAGGAVEKAPAEKAAERK